MSTAMTATTPDGAIMERVIAVGDLSKLTATERTQYYSAVCKSVGLNPLTRPFEYITLNSKLTLYARKDCTDQLRQIHNVSIIALDETERDGVYCVTAKAQNAEGRTDMAKGAVNLNSLKGEALANAIMKAETKAKRRVTLSICGLGFLDETEVDAIPQSRPGIQPEMTPMEVLTASFARYEVTAEMIVAYLGHPLDSVTDEEMAGLRGIWVKVANGEEWKSVIDPKSIEPEVVADQPTLNALHAEILELGRALTDFAVAPQAIEDIVDAKAGVRIVEHIQSVTDANAIIAALKVKLEAEQKQPSRRRKN